MWHIILRKLPTYVMWKIAKPFAKMLLPCYFKCRAFSQVAWG